MKRKAHIGLVFFFVLLLPVIANAKSFGYKWMKTPRTVYFQSNMDSIGRLETSRAMTKWNQIKVGGISPVRMALSTNSQSNSVDFQGSILSYVAYCDISHSDTEIFSVNIDLNTTYYNFSQGVVEGCFVALMFNQ